jgi:hypothetical protein
LALFAVTLAGACANVTPINTNLDIVTVVSVQGPIEPLDPAGPRVSITLKNTSAFRVTALTAELTYEIDFMPTGTGSGPIMPQVPPSGVVFDFGVTGSNPLLPGNSATSTLLLNNALIDIRSPYSLDINVEYRNDVGQALTTSYPQQVNIVKPAASATAPGSNNVFAEADSPVRYFLALPSPQGYPPSIIVLDNTTMPFPPGIYTVTPGETMYLMIFPNEKIKADFSQAKYVFFNKDSDELAQIVFPPEAGPFGPYAIAPAYFYAPGLSGNYEIRVYFGDEIAASQSLVVN